MAMVKTWRRQSYFETTPEDESHLNFGQYEIDTKPDWKLQVFRRQIDQKMAIVDTYLIHQDVVSFGPRRSKYLRHLLKKSRRDQSLLRRGKQSRKVDEPMGARSHPWSNGGRTRTLRGDKDPTPLSCIDLDDEHARMIPPLLDFIYFYSKEEDDDDNNNGAASSSGAVGGLNESLKSLYELAVMWKVPDFQIAMAEFQIKRFTAETALDALNFASQLSSSALLQKHMSSRDNETDPMLKSTMTWLATHMIEMKPSQLASIDPSLLLSILRQNQSLGVGYRIDDFARSKIVACCIHHRRHLREASTLPLMAKEVLYGLTEETLLPFINPKFEAPVLLLAEAQIRPDHIDIDHFNPMSRGLSNLEKRCIKSISTYWDSCYKGFSSSSLSILSSSSNVNSKSGTYQVDSDSVGGRSSSSHDAESKNQSSKGEEGLLEFLHELPSGVLIELLGATARNCGGVSRLRTIPRPWTRSRLPSIILQLIHDFISSSCSKGTAMTADDAITDDEQSYDDDAYSDIFDSCDSAPDDICPVDQTELAYYLCDLYECGEHNGWIEI